MIRIAETPPTIVWKRSKDRNSYQSADGRYFIARCGGHWVTTIDGHEFAHSQLQSAKARAQMHAEGFAPRRQCTDCKGVGNVLLPGGWSSCESCNGRGVI